MNPLLNAAAQQFAVDTSRAWANAAAAAALFASQLQQQNSGSSGVGPTAAAAQQQFQQAAALNLVSLQNFPFVDYARMMHVPNRKWDLKWITTIGLHFRRQFFLEIYPGDEFKEKYILLKLMNFPKDSVVFGKNT